MKDEWEKERRRTYLKGEEEQEESAEVSVERSEMQAKALALHRCPSRQKIKNQEK